jgi:hypothetical protein
LNYYYTVASLPMLFYDRDLPISREAFLEACDRDLAPDDRGIMDEARIGDVERGSSGCGLLDGWRRWETGLRNELVRLRAHRKGWDAEKHLRESEGVLGTAEVARDAFGQDSPLSGEDVLNRARWSFIEELEVGHHFDLEKLVAYYLKLQILERKASFRSDEGSERLESVLAQRHKLLGTG